MDEKKPDTTTPGTNPVTDVATGTEAHRPAPAITPAPIPAAPAFPLALASVLVTVKTIVTDEASAERIVRSAHDQGLDNAATAAAMTEAMWASCGAKPIQAAALVSAFKPAPAAPLAPNPAPAPGPFSGFGGGQSSLLAPVPAMEGSFLDGLSQVQIGKINRNDVMNAVRVAIARKAGLFSVPPILAAMMMDYVKNRMEEQAPPEYYELEDEIVKQDNGDVLRALGVSGRYTTKERKEEFLESINRIWDPTQAFYGQLSEWVNSVNATLGGGVALTSIFANMATGGGFGAMMRPTLPDTSVLHESSQILVQAINRAFAGSSLPAATALASEAERINKFLMNPAVVRYTGCTNREELARTISGKIGGSLVTPEYRSLEQNVTQFVLSVYELDKLAVKGSQNEGAVFMELHNLGTGIRWERMFDNKPGTGRPNGRGSANGNGDDNRRPPAGGYGAPHPVAIRDQQR